jgi:excisionase family DNA binding protein
MMTQEQELIRPAEAAKLFGVPVATIKSWIARGRIEKYKSELRGNDVYVDAAELRRKLTPRKQES